jgi:hypothetical protein
MKRALITAALTVLALLVLEGVALGQGYNPWQPDPNAPKVPFPVINPLRGLNNALNPNRAGQPQPSPTPYYVYTAPVATPPPNLPPGVH